MHAIRSSLVGELMSLEINALQKPWWTIRVELPIVHISADGATTGIQLANGDVICAGGHVGSCCGCG